MNVKITAILLLVLFILMASDMGSATVIGSKHDLSTPGTPTPCEFCHTPHFANKAVDAPLWNRFITSGATYQVYQSSTMNTVCSNPPSGISLVCLGCHDGVITGGDNKHNLVNGPGHLGVPDITSWPNCERCHPDIYGSGPKIKWIGTDLRNDHPISMPYPTAAEDPAFHPPADPQKGWSDVKLVKGRVECTSCHEPHNPNIVPFLRKSNSGSALCLTCHNK